LTARGAGRLTALGLGDGVIANEPSSKYVGSYTAPRWCVLVGAMFDGEVVKSMRRAMLTRTAARLRNPDTVEAFEVIARLDVGREALLAWLDALP
jgi:hypothetical protein